MVSNFHEIIQMLSVLVTILPIIVCFMIFNKGSMDIRLFLFFFLFGFFTDILMYSLNKFKNYDYLETIYNVYTLVEATFFYWLIFGQIKEKFKPVVKLLYLLTLVYWVILVILRINIGPNGFLIGQYFDPVYEIPVSFLAGFVLLQMVEREDSISDYPMFWIFIGIFFYCFCTFFISIFLNSYLSKNLWFLHNIFNIITLVFFTLGLWKYYLMQKDRVIV